jgi:hypothetical protein
MRLSGSFFLLCTCAAIYALPTGCGGSIQVVEGDGGGGGSGGSNGGSNGSSSGVILSSSSGSPGSGSGTSNGGTGGSSSGAPVTDPKCVGQPVPDIAKLCPDGVTTSTPYYTWTGTQCVLTFSPCPNPVVNPGGPNMMSSSSSGGTTFATTCMSGPDCGPYAVCCATLTGTTPGTICQKAGPCSTLPILGMPLQLCATTSECIGGQICGKPTSGILTQLGLSFTICLSPQLDASVD